MLRLAVIPGKSAGLSNGPNKLWKYTIYVLLSGINLRLEGLNVQFPV